MADIFPYWRINGGNKNNETVTGGIFYCRDSAKINGISSSFQTFSWLDSAVL